MTEKVILVGCRFPQMTEEEFQMEMEELKSLVDTVQAEVAAEISQARVKPEPSTYVGKGKLAEIMETVEEVEADLVVFNGELSPGQVRNLDREMEIRVIDRTQLILDIFAARAQTREGNIQVELAQLSYLLPRLAGQGESLSRLGGGIGTRGPGETKLETDRRHILKRMDDLKKQLADVKAHRESYRKQRRKNKAVQFALVGYTNAGKSTLLNSLTNAEAFQENLLFATLDPLTRQMQLPSGYPVLLTDTVGFIKNLPTTLIAAFRSTLEEAAEADVLLHVVDAADPNAYSQMETVDKLLEELDATSIPVITVLNKADRLEEHPFLGEARRPAIYVSAFHEADILSLQEMMESTLKEQMVYYHVKVPIDDGKSLADIQNYTMVEHHQLLEEENNMEYSGYALPDHPVNGTLKNFSI